jgi:hypothetical protein
MTPFRPDAKRSRLESAGAPCYWVVDPAEPSPIAWELREGTYVQAARVSGAEAYATLPFPVRVVPADLVADC